ECTSNSLLTIDDPYNGEKLLQGPLALPQPTVQAVAVGLRQLKGDTTSLSETRFLIPHPQGDSSPPGNLNRIRNSSVEGKEKKQSGDQKWRP
ncbi:hypothetical protein L9F63_001045, partial [Diploptera punctata]